MGKNPCDELKEVAVGPRGRVVVTPELSDKLEAVAMHIKNLSERGKRADREHNAVKRVRAQMKAACDNGFNGGGVLKFQQRVRAGGRGEPEVPIFRIGSDQYRIYGGFLDRGDRPCFVGVEIDEAKKQDAADSALLVSAGRRIAELIRAAKANPLKAGESWPKPVEGAK